MYPKIIITSLITVLIAVVVTQVARVNAYAGLNVAEKIGEYHIRVNDITNEHFDALVSFFEEKEDITTMMDAETRERFSAPTNPDSQCTRDENTNFSTTCLAHKLNKEYLELVESLSENLESADIDELRNNPSITSGINSIGTSNEFVAKQLELSSELQTQTLNFYKQTLLAYPLHLQYEITIDELNEFLSNLKQLNRKISLYPSKFQNASTALCQ